MKLAMKPELLAPAGGMRELCAAVQSGADAVYLGADRFSARSGAKNFDKAGLAEAIEYCHLRGVKVHLAANTLIKQSETADFLSALSEAYRMGIDAVIIQDIGMAKRAKDIMPDIVMHASTQMTVSTAEGVKFLEKMGFSRVVLARELSSAQIQKIRQSVQAELEIFIHGALCFCYSGQCYMSSIIGRRSGNRGMCAQPCRLPYQLIRDNKVQKNGYLLSPKDLCLVNRISELSEIGVDSLKIEGRLKSAEYVAATVGVYRKLLDGGMMDEDDMESLMGAFNRSGFTEGWFGGGKNFMSGNSPSNIANKKIGENYAKFTVENANFRRIGVKIKAEIKIGKPMSAVFEDSDKNTVSVQSQFVAETAQKTPLAPERVKEQLEKLGESIYYAENIDVTIEQGAVLPISQINYVRRLACEKLDRQRLKLDSKIVREYIPQIYTDNSSKQMYITAVCDNIRQAKVAARCGVRRVILTGGNKGGLNEAETVFLCPPVGIEKTDIESVMVMNAAQIESNRGKKLYGGFRLNITNSESVSVFNMLESITLSCELNLKDLKKINKPIDTEVIAYGRIPLMVMRGCPAQINGVCKGEGGYYLKDRYKEIFPIACRKGCISELLNSKPVYMADRIKDIKNAGINGLQLWFFDESEDEVLRIINCYKQGIEGGTPEYDKEFTRGHFYRGMV